MRLDFIDYAGHVETKELLQKLQDEKEQRSQIPVNQGDNEGYNIGKALGITEGLTIAMDIIKNMPKKPREALKRSERV